MNLNLARKWRSKQFDEIVGQELAVRLVQNSLYRSLLFPVYLLSGTRGTGKTSTGRIFAAALNCSKLEEFQKDPKNNMVPCLACESCAAMLQGNHPDFIEIDAASHTGVDNVRQIIDAASFVPVLGKKKIYLIDEAHMLSKAAFNAFLKILEEPPPTVVFMLATTDPHKIIPTVLSRCFQIFFEPIKPMKVVEHLTYICEQEGLRADPDALLLIAQETEGSMRDALNMLERLRTLPEVLTASGEPLAISKQAVIHLLGSIDEDRLVEVLGAVIANDPSQVLTTIGRVELTRYNPSMIWKKLVETLRRSLWLKQGVNPDDAPVSEQLQAFVAAVSYQRLIGLLDLCYTYELSFAKTAVPTTMLEVLLLKMTTGTEVQAAVPPTAKKPASARPVIPTAVKPVQTVPKASLTVSPTASPKPSATVLPVAKQVVKEKVVPKPEPVKAEVSVQQSEPKEAAPTGKWAQFLAEIEGLSDPLVKSVFKQGDQPVEKEGKLEITFSKDLVFFGEWLTNTKKVWQPIIDTYYGVGTEVVPLFTGASTKKKPVVVQTMPIPESQPQQQPPRKEFKRNAQPPKPPVGTPVSPDAVKDLETSSMIMEAFPGTLRVENLPKEGT